MTLLKVEDLCVEFSIHGRKLRAVRGLSFEIREGEAVGLVGESGCGKSAAIQAILKLDSASMVRGRVQFRGENLLEKSIQELSRFRGKEIGMVFQDPMMSLNPTMKIGEQIIEGLVYHKIATRKKAKEKALDLLHLVGISEPEIRYSQYPHSLSGGMRQRVLIAIAIAMNPRLIIADEPTTALDGTVSSQILVLLKKLSAEMNTSLLLITHDLSLVASYCERVLVMYAGKIVEQGSVDEVFLQPKHPYTQMLFKTLPRLDRPKHERIIPIDGAPPSLFSKPTGCPFAPRCPRAFEKCFKEEPSLLNQSACWNPND
jgi:oligopeptide/dipeptide ABC transporter ATP-binding protein